MAGKFEVYQDKKGEYRFRLKAGNGQIDRDRRGVHHQEGVSQRHRVDPQERS